MSMMFRHSPSLQTITATTSVDRHAERPFHPVATAATPTPARRAGRAAEAGRVWAWSIDATGTALPAWSLTAPTAGTGDAFGHAIAPDSATLAVGAYATDGAAPNQGALHLDAIGPARCTGDLDGDGTVGPADLAALLNAHA